MIRLSMYVMLSTWKQLVKHASKKKKPPVVLSGYSKNQDLTMFFVRIGRVFSGSRFRFLSDLDGFFGLGFRTRPWFFFGFGAAFSDLDFGLDLWFFFGFGAVILSDWIFQKYKDCASGESEGTLDFIVSLRIVYLHKRCK